jgi:beta-galactosidase
MPRIGHLMWTVNYEPGKLEAIAYKKGKKLTAKVETTGLPVEVVVTPYKTTLLADNSDISVINISVVDKEGREVPDADNMIEFQLEGDGKIIGVGNGDPSSHEPDKCENGWCQRRLFNGKCQVIVQSGSKAGMIKFKASSKGLWSGGTDIQTIAVSNLEINEKGKTEVSKNPIVDRIIGADISYLPELEATGMKFSDKGVQKDPLQILKDHGFNYVRLRIFNEPARDSGYSPGKGFCDLAHTLVMAKRVKDAGMKLLLDFHYSDYWADPGHQYTPAAWKGQDISQLKKSLYDFTRKVIQDLKAQGTSPDMVQVGNEINHGICWPEGNVSNMDNLAGLLKAGSAGVHAADPSVKLLLHIALGGQNEESVFFIDNMLARGVDFDIIGLSYYPKWHGTLDDLRDNLDDLARRYGKDVIVAEYSQRKEEVNQVVFDVRNKQGKGAFIWEPLNTWEKIFDDKGNANQLMGVYDDIHDRFISSQK